MFIKREDAIKRASSALTKALLINTIVTLMPPIYIFFSGSIGLHTYIALAFLAVSVASLLLVYYMRRAVDDYSIGSARAVLPIALPLSFIGGLVIVGLLVNKARKHIALLQ
ncbi:hypothetical protein IG193_04385 [Infirmifilum lucidum]|uniref:Uncharacterized protein n=1 Tax=Infirmifilum lucidum TaxID=2776706 RepID=A0A7L9FIN2_9CREN|nr:hypothetical protein [Infirmifilum lucidum]QOJ79698.1 hypothetical protein IG193_04385 [Infirmifilum lucidum]